MRKFSFISYFFLLAFGSLTAWLMSFGSVKNQVGGVSLPHYPTDIKETSEHRFLISNKGSKTVELYSPDFDKPIDSWYFTEVPTGIATSGNYAYITTFETIGKVYFLNLKTGKVEKELTTGSGATSPVLSSDGKTLYVLNRFQSTVSEIDLHNGMVINTVKVLREPSCAVISRDGNYLFVSNYLPAQRADVDTVASCVSVIDLKKMIKIKDIQLANGSNALRGMCLSPDGKYIFITHNLGRFQVPTNQLQQGWMNTSAITVVDAVGLEKLGSVLLDDPDRGAAGIWGIHCTPDKIVITHSGTHEISVVDYPEMMKKFIAYPDKPSLDYDLRFLYGIRRRIPLMGNGPRNFVVSNEKAYIPTYFSDTLNVVNLSDYQVDIHALAPNRIESAADKGEKYFHDAAYCFQGWQSCIGCHPDGRTDGMNWDLMNDGVGNPKNCKSMLYSHVTPPSMISGIRESAELAVRKGFSLIQFAEISEENASCVDEYLKALRPVPSPYLVDGKLSEKAELGKKVFDKLHCGECHSGIYFTDMKLHRIGEDIEFEKGWDTPTLIECWRTAPYLFDGRATTMEDVFEIHKHGIDKKVSKKEVEALAEYVNSL
jgi:YVTN family beta-propeller protein